MKTFLTFLLAYVLSLLAGSAIIVWIAEKTAGDETFILAFMAEALVASIAIVVFAIVYLGALDPRNISVTALILSAVLLALTAAIIAYDIWSGGLALAWTDLPLFGSVGLSGLVAIAIQWWLIRSRARRVAGGRPILEKASG
ncbi:hypothetical protein [Phreatobacter stygius]|uniref:Uncharacterized protein n=1 Tax=Phreatobacter stygius TaxID=1940610 RepID=A0A4D7B391_9HYPH|nr:hypothetical protein [Phreatobacter stygius]QCI68219.1 hypothetical protein E8M01_30735 [Phreatobacter stygius]